MLSSVAQFFTDLGSNIVNGLYSVVAGLLSALLGIIQRFAGFILSALPRSPLADLIDEIELPFQQGLGWLNWVFPVSFLLQVMAAWLAAYSVFLLLSIVMRWVKVIR